ncbi:MAG TPA: hypothetical protein VKG82_00860 [Solirubrobacteraceae bacterium]|nr:hypothetical protein [Solirubrobacteraceae bacterium]
MSARADCTPARRPLAHLCTGSLAHLLGGALDLAGALAGYALASARRRLAARIRALRGLEARPPC